MPSELPRISARIALLSFSLGGTVLSLPSLHLERVVKALSSTPSSTIERPRIFPASIFSDLSTILRFDRSGTSIVRGFPHSLRYPARFESTHLMVHRPRRMQAPRKLPRHTHKDSCQQVLVSSVVFYAPQLKHCRSWSGNDGFPAEHHRPHGFGYFGTMRTGNSMTDPRGVPSAGPASISS